MVFVLIFWFFFIKEKEQERKTKMQRKHIGVKRNHLRDLRTYKRINNI